MSHGCSARPPSKKLQWAGDKMVNQACLSLTMSHEVFASKTWRSLYANLPIWEFEYLTETIGDDGEDHWRQKKRSFRFDSLFSGDKRHNNAIILTNSLKSSICTTTTTCYALKRPKHSWEVRSAERWEKLQVIHQSSAKCRNEETMWNEVRQAMQKWWCGNS